MGPRPEAPCSTKTNSYVRRFSRRPSASFSTKSQIVSRSCDAAVTDTPPLAVASAGEGARRDRMAHSRAPRRGARFPIRGRCPRKTSPTTSRPFLIRGRSRRAWRVRALMQVVEWSPLIVGRRPLSKMGLGERRRFVVERYVDGHGVWGICAKARYLVLMGVYGDGRLHAPTELCARVETTALHPDGAQRWRGGDVVTTRLATSASSAPARAAASWPAERHKPGARSSSSSADRTCAPRR